MSYEFSQNEEITGEIFHARVFNLLSSEDIKEYEEIMNLPKMKVVSREVYTNKDSMVLFLEWFELQTITKGPFE